MYPSQLSIHAATKRFGDRIVLDRIELAARPGERIGGRNALSAAHCRLAPTGASVICLLLHPTPACGLR